MPLAQYIGHVKFANTGDSVCCASDRHGWGWVQIWRVSCLPGHLGYLGTLVPTEVGRYIRTGEPFNSGNINPQLNPQRASSTSYTLVIYFDGKFTLLALQSTSRPQTETTAPYTMKPATFASVTAMLLLQEVAAEDGACRDQVLYCGKTLKNMGTFLHLSRSSDGNQVLTNVFSQAGLPGAFLSGSKATIECIQARTSTTSYCSSASKCPTTAGRCPIPCGIGCLAPRDVWMPVLARTTIAARRLLSVCA